ncbi:MAG: sdaA [Verrucomicrobiales bacterium]|nr:sdaA [Verrucomicrobiales bacterium]
MNLSVFDLFTIGIGPSSSHTVGPMRAARDFALRLEEAGELARTASVLVQLYGSLGATGKGHGTGGAVLLGLTGATPEGVDVDRIPALLENIRTTCSLTLLDKHPIPFTEREHLIFERRRSLPWHPNGMRLAASDAGGALIREAIYYSTGGGFIVRGEETESPPASRPPAPFPITSGAELLAHCASQQCSISGVMWKNELTWRSAEEISAGLQRIWEAMQACVSRGCATEGMLPGGLKVERRAAGFHHQLVERPEAALRDPLSALDWVNLYAMAVNEENAAGGRVVTAPTNGAAGILPAVLHYADRFCPPPAQPGGIHCALLTAAAIGFLYKRNASISGADVGCQGEVGVACSMAAGALCEYLGGTPAQVENAAEIGMEHNLGLTCDPIGGLVQIPCIERNAMGSVKAINAARMALRGNGTHHVSLDKVIRTMRDTGRDMSAKYKETSRGGLAVNIVEC